MKMLRFAIAGVVAAALSTGLHVTASNSGGDDRDRDDRLAATLIGFDEVPSVSTPARGRFRARITTAGVEPAIAYSLTFSGLSSAVQQSHIHFAQPSVNGGIVLWLCQGAVAPNPALNIPAPPPCPQEGTVEGTLTAANVIATGTAQQIGAGEFAEVLAAIRAGYAYVNVHSATSSGGEIRGQVRTGDNNGQRD